MTPAERQRAYRERRKRDEHVARVPITGAMIEELIEAGYLAAWDADNPEAVGVAFRRSYDDERAA